VTAAAIRCIQRFNHSQASDPATASYLIVNITLAVPGMILGETTLSFLGLGLQNL
jgi:ABC-type dipeptide/oligopeptide/nickel transport system permease subunit